MYLYRGAIKEYTLDFISKNSPMSPDDEFFISINTLKHKPDAVAFPDEDVAARLGLPKRKHILFLFVQRSVELSWQALEELSDIYDLSQDSPEIDFATGVVDGYGCHRFLDLGGIYAAFRQIGDDESESREVFNPYATRESAGLLPEE